VSASLTLGRRKAGAANSQAKLTDEQVREIRASTSRGTLLAKRYGISACLVSLIRNRKAWTHIQ
jgi:hypothetical protein